jgi:hypothetical protein
MESHISVFKEEEDESLIMSNKTGSLMNILNNLSISSSGKHEMYKENPEEDQTMRKSKDEL